MGSSECLVELAPILFLIFEKNQQQKWKMKIDFSIETFDWFNFFFLFWVGSSSFVGLKEIESKLSQAILTNIIVCSSTFFCYCTYFSKELLLTHPQRHCVPTTYASQGALGRDRVHISLQIWSLGLKYTLATTYSWLAGLPCQTCRPVLW